MTLLHTYLFRSAFAQGCGVLCADAYNALNCCVLGGVLGDLTDRKIINYRAFQRCLWASLGGFAVPR